MSLRLYLRQDPDIIMIGEMRDGEICSTGSSALTGHLVLSTLAITNTAAGAIIRMQDMGERHYHLVCQRCLAQRLVLHCVFAPAVALCRRSCLAAASGLARYFEPGTYLSTNSVG